MELTLRRSLKIALLLPLTYLLAGNVTVRAEPEPNRSKPTLPLLFEANQGQAGSVVEFVVRGSGYNLYLNRSELMIGAPQKPHSRGKESVEFEFVRMKLAGSLPGAGGVASGKVAGQINYVTGPRPSDWLLGVPAYQSVKYESVYSGVDVIYYARGQQLEYDFVVHPGSETDAIRLAFQGARDVRVDSAGDLVLSTESREVRHLRPVAYQEIDGVRRTVDARYRLYADGTTGFDLGDHDARHELVIDPVLTIQYSSYLGGSGADFIYGVAVDADGQAHVAGVTSSPDFPIIGNTGSGLNRAFVAKFTADGSGLVYSTIIGASDGTGRTLAAAIAVDSSGHAHVTGESDVPASEFPTTTGAAGWPGAGDNAIYVKLNESGAPSILILFGGDGNENGSGIAVDSDEAATIVGSYSPTSTSPPAGDLPVTSNAYQATFRGGPSDGFVTRFSPDGSALNYSSYLGGSNDDSAVGIATDVSKNLIVVGSTGSLDFPTSNSVYQKFRGGPADAFVTKIDGSTGGLTYSTYLGGSEDEAGTAVAVNSSGNAYVTGSTLSTNFPVKNAFQSTIGSIAAFDAFVTCLTPTGSLIYSTYLGGNGLDQGWGIAVDDAGAAHVAGMTAPGGPVSTFPLLGVPDYTAQLSDGFLTKLAPTGSTLLGSMLLGGSADDVAYAVATNGKGTVWAAGDRAHGEVGWLTSVAFPNTLISSHFRKTAIAQDRYIWFNANVVLSGVPPAGAIIRIEDAAVEFTANGKFYRLPVPDGEIVVTGAGCPSTVFQGGKWLTTAPATTAAVFMAGVTFQTPVALPGGITPVNWSGRITSNVDGVTADWRWGAAVYTTFGNYDALLVKAADGKQDCTYSNSNSAGTPENFKQFLVAGARGPGGSHYTGKFTSTQTVQPYLP